MHRFFNHFHMSIEDFDYRGNIRFNDEKPPQNDRRGGWPYYPPVRCKRYGIRVSGKYDDKKDTWLKMDGRNGEWAVAFHGVGFLTQKKIKSIFKGREEGKMLIPGRGQVYKKTKAVNKPS